MGTSNYRVLTRTDLKAFSPRATDLILRAMDLGATGRISQKGHAILRSPDGGTISVSTLAKGAGGLALANTEAQWKRVFGALDAADRAAKGSPGATTPGSTQQPLSAPLGQPTAARCPVVSCGQRFATEGALYSHTVREHYRCPEGCGYVARNMEELRDHHGKKHTEPEPVLLEQPTTTQEVPMGHQNPEPEYECSVCRRDFAGGAALATHMRSHSGQDFTCPDCGQDCRNAQGLASHTRYTHSDVKPLQMTVQDPTDPQQVLAKIRLLVGGADAGEVATLRQRLAEERERTAAEHAKALEWKARAEQAEARLAKLREALS